MNMLNDTDNKYSISVCFKGAALPEAVAAELRPDVQAVQDLGGGARRPEARASPLRQKRHRAREPHRAVARTPPPCKYRSPSRTTVKLLYITLVRTNSIKDDFPYSILIRYCNC